MFTIFNDFMVITIIEKSLFNLSKSLNHSTQTYRLQFMN